MLRFAFSYEVLPSALVQSSMLAAASGGAPRTYYIMAETVQWDYAPQGYVE